MNRILAALICLITAFTSFAQQDLRLLIVFPDSMQPAVEEYRQYRTTRDISTRLLSLAEVGRLPNERELKKVLHRVRDTFAFNHLLLIGSLFHIPMHESTSQTHHDHFYAQAAGDSLPTIAVGRLPVDNQQQLRQYLLKVKTAMADGPAPPTGLALHGASSRDLKVAARATGWMKMHGYQLLPASERPDFVRLATDTPLTLVFHIGLGTATGWVDLPTNFTVHDARELDNRPIPMVISVACSTAGPQFRHTLATALVLNDRGGALTYMGCTGNCLVDWADELGLTILEATRTSRSIGQAFLQGKRQYHAAFSRQHPFETRHSIRQFILAGDPTLAIP